MRRMKGMRRRIATLGLIIAMAVNESAYGYAAEVVDSGVIEEITAEDTETSEGIEDAETGEEIVTSENDEETTSDDAITEETGEESLVEGVADEASETQSDIISDENSVVSEESITEEIVGLESLDVISDINKELRNTLAATASGLEKAEECVDYVADEVVTLAETETEAKAYAKAFGGELKSYSKTVAVIKLCGKITVSEAVEMALNSKDVLLPAVFPNYYRRAYGSISTDNDENENSEIIETIEDISEETVSEEELGCWALDKLE